MSNKENRHHITTRWLFDQEIDDLLEFLMSFPDIAWSDEEKKSRRALLMLDRRATVVVLTSLSKEAVYIKTKWG